MLDISLLTKHDIEAAGRIWRTLEKEVHPSSITCRWDFVSTWIELYGDVAEYWFAVGTVKDQVVGMTLITRETHRPLPLPVTAYHLGTNGEPFSDAVQLKHGKILVKKGHEKEFYAAILEAINTFKWEEIVLDDVDAEMAEGFVGVLKSSNKTSFWKATTFPESLSSSEVDEKRDAGRRQHDERVNFKVDIERNACQFMDLAKLRKEKLTVMDALSNDTRYSIRRSMKALGDAISVEWAADEVQAEDILDELIKLYNDNWHKRGKRGMFASERFTRFQYAIIRKLFKTGTILLCRVKSEQYGTLGCIYMMVADGIAYGYQMGLKDFSDIPLETINKKRLRVGFIVHALCMQEAMDWGLDGYNFGVGEYGYKSELTNDVSEVVSLSVKKGLKPALRDSIVRFYLKSEGIQKLKSWLGL